MSKIIFNSDKYITVSVRLKSTKLDDIDKLTQNIRLILGDEISRNQVLEKLIEDSMENSVFVLNGKEKSFNEILNFTEDSPTIVSNVEENETISNE